MTDNKITLPTIYGDIQCHITTSGDVPKDSMSLINMDVYITPLLIDQTVSFEKDPFVNMFIDVHNKLQLEFRLSYIKTKMAQIIEDEEYYYLTIHENVRVTNNKALALRVRIKASFAKIIFNEKPSKEEIVKRLRLEMASHQTTYNPNADGRLPKGTIYGWGGTS